MPQMGESIAEGTVSKWLKELGDTVKRDEPILEISTDKVDAEIPSPSEGTLVEILVSEGETVEVGTIVAYVDPEGGAPAGAAEKASPPVEAAAQPPTESEPAPGEGSPPPPAVPGDRDGGEESAEERLRSRSTPVVRKIAEEEGIDISRVPGTGRPGGDGICRTACKGEEQERRENGGIRLAAPGISISMNKEAADHRGHLACGLVWPWNRCGGYIPAPSQD